MLIQGFYILAMGHQWNTKLNRDISPVLTLIECLMIWLIFVLSICHSNVASAQAKLDSLPAVSIKDKVFENVLNEYVKEAKGKDLTIAVFLERYDNDYTYTFQDIGLYDRFKKNPTANFGRWNGHTLLFYSGLEELLSSVDTSKINQIKRFLRPKLPDAYSEKPVPGDPKLIEMETITHDPIIWRFKVRDGKLLWLRRGLAYQSEKVPYMK